MLPRFPVSPRAFRLAISLAAVLLSAMPARAQVAGVIQGIVADTQGGVLPGVTFTLHNTESGALRTTVSESDGQFRFAGLQPAAGMQTREKTLKELADHAGTG